MYFNKVFMSNDLNVVFVDSIEIKSNQKFVFVLTCTII